MDKLLPLDNLLQQARALDAGDPLAAERANFHMPQHPSRGGEALYFTGNSLGLQPRAAEHIIAEELEDWRKFGVEGHFKSRRPWVNYQDELTDGLALIAGARPLEVVAMNTLTVNLHLLLISFFRPSGNRTQLMIEAGAFPSDRYAALSQLQLHGLNPEDHLIEIAPRPGEHTLRTEDIEARIAQAGNRLACCALSGVQYYTGQLFDMARITAAAHKVGATCGFDLAHAAGNVPLKLHDWNVDFACWCGYKYLNGGPGCAAAAFVHERHARRPELLRLAGWWGHNADRRFKMEPDFDSMSGASGWQMSNAPVMNMAALYASLETFKRVGIVALREKSLALTAFLESGIHAVATDTGERLEILTPADPTARGCQLSVVAHGHGLELFKQLTDRGVIADWREPGVIRLAPVPLYNSFEDIAQFLLLLAEGLRTSS
ncbi:MAG: kynureninase [Flavobacteriales bacterium]|nr:kynureninase [Flavobacteriales bacterium]